METNEPGQKYLEKYQSSAFSSYRFSLHFSALEEHDFDLIYPSQLFMPYIIISHMIYHSAE